MDTLLLIDGNAIMHRAFHAIPPFETKSGLPTNVIYGFLSMLIKSMNDFHPETIIVCFDTPKETFRNKLSAEYQAHRPKIDDSFIEQIPLVKEMLDCMHIPRFEKDGYEADDVIGTIAKKCKSDTKVLILTGDKDIFQLIDTNIFVVSPQFNFKNTTLYDAAAVRVKLGVDPKHIPDWKGLAGDPSDNYKGADGIGPKTAVKLIEEFGSVENLLKNKETLPEGKVKNTIINHEKDIIMSKKLATIDTNVPISFDVSENHIETLATPELSMFLDKVEIRSLKQRIFFGTQKVPAKPKPEKKKNTDVVQSELFS